VAESERSNSDINRAFVLMQCLLSLTRSKIPARTRTTGYDFWLHKVKQFNGIYINAEMGKAFISPIKYRRRFGL
jgi:hypothetical protein